MSEMSEVDKWADEISEVCRKYAGEDWVLVFKSTDGGYDFNGFVSIPVEDDQDEMEQR